MKLLVKKHKGDPLSASEYNDLIDAVQATNIIPSPTIGVQRTGAGTVLTVKQVATPVNFESAGGGVTLGLREVWSGSTQYRVNETVIFKPDSSSYYNIYKCLDASAGAVDCPSGASGKWEKITVGDTVSYYASGTAYTSGQTVRFGTPYQEYVYACSASGGAASGQSPAVAPTSWTVSGSGIVYGIPAWPPTSGTATYKVPFYTQILVNERYNTTTHDIYQYYTKSTFNRLGALVSMETIVEEVVTEAVACVINT